MFRNRLDATILFNALDSDSILQVVDKFIIELETQLESKGVSLQVTRDVRHWLAEKGFDSTMGARPMARLIKEEIKRPLAEELLFGKLEHGGRVNIKMESGKLHFTMDAHESDKSEDTERAHV